MVQCGRCISSVPHTSCSVSVSVSALAMLLVCVQILTVIHRVPLAMGLDFPSIYYTIVVSFTLTPTCPAGFDRLYASLGMFSSCFSETIKAGTVYGNIFFIFSCSCFTAAVMRLQLRKSAVELAPRSCCLSLDIILNSCDLSSLLAYHSMNIDSYNSFPIVVYHHDP